MWLDVTDCVYSLSITVKHSGMCLDMSNIQVCVSTCQTFRYVSRHVKHSGMCLDMSNIQVCVSTCQTFRYVSPRVICQFCNVTCTFTLSATGQVMIDVTLLMQTFTLTGHLWSPTLVPPPTLLRIQVCHLLQSNHFYLKLSDTLVVTSNIISLVPQ